MKRLPPIEELRRLFDYDPETGVVTRKVAVNNNKAKKGDFVTSKDIKGYLRVTISGKRVKLHRVCYALYHGHDPYPMQCDHVNHDRTDNRICNLRLVTNQENQKNRSKIKSNTSGVCGVCFHKTLKKWHAYIAANGKREHLGTFTNKADAIAARKAAEIKYGYHENHGGTDQPKNDIADLVSQLSLIPIEEEEHA